MHVVKIIRVHALLLLSHRTFCLKWMITDWYIVCFIILDLRRITLSSYYCTARILDVRSQFERCCMCLLSQPNRCNGDISAEDVFTDHLILVHFSSSVFTFTHPSSCVTLVYASKRPLWPNLTHSNVWEFKWIKNCCTSFDCMWLLRLIFLLYSYI